MARSYQTEKPSVLARYRIPRDRDNRFVYPRVIARRPSPGDVHPLSKQALSGILRQTPIEYLYGLKRIELRPRRNNKIGEPFGCYLPDEKTIWLYSSDGDTWKSSFHRKDPWLARCRADGPFATAHESAKQKC